MLPSGSMPKTTIGSLFSPQRANAVWSMIRRPWAIASLYVTRSVVTQLGIDLGALLGGVIVVEIVFGLPGLGQLAVQSVTTQDLPVIIGTVVLASAFIVAANILVDICYAILDPRVRLR